MCLTVSLTMFCRVAARATLKNPTEILKTCNRGIKMNFWESFFILVLQQQDVLIEEDRVNVLNPLYALAHVTRHYFTDCLLSDSVHFRLTHQTHQNRASQSIQYRFITFLIKLQFHNYTLYQFITD